MPTEPIRLPHVTSLNLTVRAVGGGWTADATFSRERYWGDPPVTEVVTRDSFVIFSYDYQDEHLLRGIASGLEQALASCKIKGKTPKRSRKTKAKKR